MSPRIHGQKSWSRNQNRIQSHQVRERTFLQLHKDPRRKTGPECIGFLLLSRRAPSGDKLRKDRSQVQYMEHPHYIQEQNQRRSNCSLTILFSEPGRNTIRGRTIRLGLCLRREHTSKLHGLTMQVKAIPATGLARVCGVPPEVPTCADNSQAKVLFL